MGVNPSKRGGLNLTIIIQDETWRKLGTWKWNTSDIKKQNYVIQSIDDAFGIKLQKKTDIDWIKD